MKISKNKIFLVVGTIIIILLLVRSLTPRKKNVTQEVKTSQATSSTDSVSNTETIHDDYVEIHKKLEERVQKVVEQTETKVHDYEVLEEYYYNFYTDCYQLEPLTLPDTIRDTIFVKPDSCWVFNILQTVRIINNEEQVRSDTIQYRQVPIDYIETLYGMEDLPYLLEQQY